jgi:gag-polypeptide of LTR copia-type
MDMMSKLQELRCEEGGNICTHFDSLIDLRKQLTVMDRAITDQEFATILMQSVPPSYRCDISQINTAADISARNITPTTVMRIITNEYDTCVREQTGSYNRDKAFATRTARNKNQKGQSQGQNRCDIECYNCHKKGHTKAQCWAKGGGKEGQYPQRRSND